MREAIQDLIPGANFISRPRLSRLTYAGEKKITRLPTRSAVVAFSANDVYSIAELIRRQRGGTAVVLGALSPRTRNAQVALYQAGDVDFLVATDAIGMGLNLDVDHVAFSAIRKFDGQAHRTLTPGEIGQIAGRAGRHMNDGTFGVTGNADAFDADLIERLETHTFDGVRTLQWRNRSLDMASLDRLRDSLREVPREQRLTRARMADDVLALEAVAHDKEVVALAQSPAAVARLWDVCQVPDYRKISAQNHAELVATIYKFLLGPEEHVPEDWFAKQVAFADRTDGDIDTLANRIAHIRTWTFVSNRADWLKDPGHWQDRTRAIEDSLSDALHECLTHRFVDRRTSALMRGLRDKEELAARIEDDGAIHVESHYVGRLTGFRFTPETRAEGIHGKAARHAAAQVLARELALRARRVAAAKADAFKLAPNAHVLWRNEEIARLEPAEDPLKPQVVLLADEHLAAPDRDKVQARLESWIGEIVAERLKPLAEVAKADDITGLARGIAFRLTESFGILKRELVADEMKHLDQVARAQLRKYGVRFGAFNIYFPTLLKPAAAELAARLWALKHAPQHGLALDTLPELPRPGLTSVPADPKGPEAFYRACGFHVCGPRAVRLDILERLADLIRPLLAWRPGPERSSPAPTGSTGDGGFTVTSEMMSILGCSPDELSNVLKALGFRLERRRAPASSSAALPEAAEDLGEAEAQVASSEKTDAEMPQAAEGPSEAPSDAAPQAPETATTCATAPSEPEYVEIWRPRRHKHGDGKARRRERGPSRTLQPSTETTKPAAGDGGGATDEGGRDSIGLSREERAHKRQRRHDRERPRGRGDREGALGERRGGERRRAEERSSPTLFASASPKKGAVDPDSPFASLGALREVLEKQAREKGSP
jgi:ATP-dependent RNA helicase SUPV3L1/SUV3